jgi:pyruvate kinase
LKHGLAKVGDQIAITAGVPFGEPGTTNLLRIARIWPV